MEHRNSSTSHMAVVEQLKAKIAEVKQALASCVSEKSLLLDNLSTTRQQIDASFQKHMMTLQCRMNWLNSHADTIWHLKVGSLDQQIAELDLLLNELKSCLADAGTESVFRVLESFVSSPLQPCESSEMSFKAHDDRMEEWIVSFGEVQGTGCSINDTTFSVASNDEEDGIEVVGVKETIVVQEAEDPKSVEMEVKSVEMYHLTPLSAHQHQKFLEEEEFEKVEMESVVDVVDQSDQWLRPKPLDAEKRNTVEECAIGEDANPWIRRLRSSSRSFSQSEESEEFVVAPAAPTKTMYMEEEGEKEEEKMEEQEEQEELKPSHKRRHGGANLEHLVKLFLAPNSKYLRLDGALNSLYLQEATPKRSRSRTENNNHISNSNSNRRRNNSVVETLSSYLLVARSSTTDAGSPSSEELPSSHQQSNVAAGSGENRDRCSNTMRANINHFNEILSAPADCFLARQPKSECESRIPLPLEEMRVPPTQMIVADDIQEQTEHSIEDVFSVSAEEFIAVQSRSGDGRVESTTLIRPNDTLTHMSSLQNNPDEVYLLQRKGSSTTEEGDMCAWLCGDRTKNTKEECKQCNGFACDSNSRLGEGWIRTAADW